MINRHRRQLHQNLKQVQVESKQEQQTRPQLWGQPQPRQDPRHRRRLDPKAARRQQLSRPRLRQPRRKKSSSRTSSRYSPSLVCLSHSLRKSSTSYTSCMKISSSISFNSVLKAQSFGNFSSAGLFSLTSHPNWPT